MKILHLITGLSRGGAENMLYKLLSSMDQKQCESVVVSLIPGGVYTEKIEALGVPVFSMGMKAGVPSLLAFSRLRRLIRQIDPDVVHGWMYHAALVALLAAQGRPVVVGIRRSLSDIAREKLLTRAVIAGLGFLSRRAAWVCYNSQLSRKQHEAEGYDPKLGIVLANGFDCTLLQPDPAGREAMRSKLGLASDAFVVGHLGRYHGVKDHSGLLAAFVIFSREHPMVHLLLAGSNVNPANAVLNNEIVAQGLVGRVHLLGERDDVPQLINVFDVLANSSLSEAFPNVLGEAMACAVPCVATDVGDSAFIIGDTGILVPAGDPEALAAALSKMANMDIATRTAMGVRARARIIEYFSLGRIAADYVSLYETILNEKRTGLGAS